MGAVSTHTSDTRTSSDDLALWRALPRLVISRRWRWLTLGVLTLMLIFIRLGIWQLDRLAERRANNALIVERTNGPALTITGEPIAAEANEFRPVTVSGTFDPSHEIVLRNRSLNGVPGVHVVTPLRIDGSDKAVLVDRGWIPLELAEPEDRQAFAVSGPVEIEGYLRTSRTPSGRFAPADRQPDEGRLDRWFRPDLARIARQIPYPILPYYVEQAAGENNVLPHPQPSIELSEGPHLGYAIQWFAFAIIVVCGYAALVVTRTKQEQEGQTEAIT